MNFRELESNILTVLNSLRTSPKNSLPWINDYYSSIKNGVYTDKETTLRLSVRDEPTTSSSALLSFLSSQPSQLSPVERVEGLDGAARELGEYLGRKGEYGHVMGIGCEKGEEGGGKGEKGGLKERVGRYGTWSKVLAENIGLAEATGKGAVLAWLVDDGNDSKNQRKNLFLPE